MSTHDIQGNVGKDEREDKNEQNSPLSRKLYLVQLYVKLPYKLSRKNNSQLFF